MESLTPGFDNSSAESVVSFHTASVTDDMSIVNRLLLQLISTVDIGELLSIYYAHIRQILPVVGCSLFSEDQCLSRGLTDAPAKRTVELQISEIRHPMVSAATFTRYSLTRKLSLTETSLLNTVHQAFAQTVAKGLRFARLTQLATKDTLTGLRNRAAFDEDAAQLRQAKHRQHQRFGLLILDLDNFKAVNDKFGHKEGDKVLISFANSLLTALRANEKAYRFGGDEFCCLLDTSEGETISLVANRLLQAVANNDLLKRHQITTSIGGTLAKPEESFADTFSRADKALYDVKSQGKHGYLLN